MAGSIPAYALAIVPYRKGIKMLVTVNNRDFDCLLISGGLSGAVISINGVNHCFSADFVKQYVLLYKSGVVRESRFIDLCVDEISDSFGEITANIDRR